MYKVKGIHKPAKENQKKNQNQIKGTVPAFEWGYIIPRESRVLTHWVQHDFGYILLYLWCSYFKCKHITLPFTGYDYFPLAADI